MSKQKQFAVLGLGRFGRSIAKTLSDNGRQVLACDHNAELVQEVSEYVTYAVQADITDEHAMKSLGLGDIDVAIIGVGSDLESSIMATFVAKEQGVPYVVAKARTTRHKSILEKIGADRVYLPEREMGVRVAMSLIAPNMIDFIELSEENSISEIEPLHEWIGKSLAKINLRAETGLSVVAIKRGKRILVSPRAEEIINEEDVLVIIGETLNFQKIHGKDEDR